MKIIRFIYNIFSTVLTIAIILVMLIVIMLGVSGVDRQNPKSILGFRAFIVLSDSMSPNADNNFPKDYPNGFNKGSIIITQKTNADKIKIGDIITYIKGDDGTLLTHRVVEINGTQFITRGDTNNIDDNPVNAELILGKKILHMNGLGTFFVNLQTPFGIICMVGVIAVGLFIIPYFLKPRGANSNNNGADVDDIGKENTEDKEN